MTCGMSCEQAKENEQAECEAFTGGNRAKYRTEVSQIQQQHFPQGCTAINTWVSDGTLQVRSRIPAQLKCQCSPSAAHRRQQQQHSAVRDQQLPLLCKVNTSILVDSKNHFLGELGGIYFPGCSHSGSARAQGTGLGTCSCT